MAKSLLKNVPLPEYKGRGRLLNGDLPQRLYAKHLDYFRKYIDPTPSKSKPSRAYKVPIKIKIKNKKKTECLDYLILPIYEIVISTATYFTWVQLHEDFHVIRLPYRSIVSKHRIPLELYIDLDSNFESKLFKEIVELIDAYCKRSKDTIRSSSELSIWMKGGEYALCRWTEAQDEIRRNPRNHEIANKNEIFQDKDLVCERAQNILSWIMKSPLVGLTIGLVNRMDVEVYLRSTAESYFNYNFVDPELLRVSMVRLAL
ncbi:piggyBac transposable element-derived protein 4-like [Vespula maculifrons]|uniref:PiggyBac transposable element-derived protein 4-like n=1 Tax=Vespula maculifrons TaxID=7453 RepID=A0ABD2AV87_VESMC